MKIAIDLDEVLAEFMVGFLVWINAELGTNYTWNEVRDYHFENWIEGVDKEELTKLLFRFYKTDAYRHAQVVDGAQQAIAELAQNHELYVVTARQEENKAVTMAWLDEHFPNTFKDVAMLNHYSRDGSPARNKGEVCLEWGCTLIVDDNPHNMQSLIDHGIDLIVFNKPWNSYLRLPPQVKRCDNWGEILATINSQNV